MEVARQRLKNLNKEIQELHTELRNVRVEYWLIVFIAAVSQFLSISVKSWFELVTVGALLGLWFWAYKEVKLTEKIFNLDLKRSDIRFYLAVQEAIKKGSNDE